MRLYYRIGASLLIAALVSAAVFERASSRSARPHHAAPIGEPRLEAEELVGSADVFSPTLHRPPTPVEPTSSENLVAIAVTDARGNPVAGAMMSARPRAGDSIEALSDHRGVAELRLEPRLRYAVAGEAPGRILTTPQGQRRAYVTDVSTAGLEFIAHRGGELDVDFDIDPPLVDPITIVCSQGRISERLPWRSGESLLLRYGRHTVFAESKSGRLKSTPVTIDIGPDEVHLVLELGEAYAIRGCCIYSEDERPSGVELRWKPLEPGAKVEKQWIPPTSGRFEVTNRVGPGTYWIGASRDWNYGSETERVVTIPDDDFVELVLPPLNDGDGLIVSAVDPYGGPLAALRFSAVNVDGARRGLTSAPLRDGRHRVRLPDAECQKIALITATSERFGSASTEMPKQGDVANIAFPLPADVEVVLLGGGDSSSVEISMSPTTGGSQVDREHRQFEDNVAHFAGLTPGNHTLRLHARSNGALQTIAEEQWSITEGHQTISLALPPVSTVTVTTRRLGPGESLWLRSESMGSTRAGRTIEHNSSSRMVFECVPWGEWVVEFSSSRSTGSALHFAVRGDMEVDFAVDRVDALRVGVEDDRGLLAGTGIHVGDLIVAFDGMSFDGLDEIQARLTAVEGLQTCSLTVRRGSRLFDCQVAVQSLVKFCQQDRAVRPVTAPGF